MKNISVMAPDKGIIRDFPKNLIPDRAWSDGLNVRFGDGYVEKVGGWQKFMAQQLDGPIMAIDNYYQFDGDEYLMIATPTTIYKYDVTNNVAIDITTTSLTGDSSDIILTETAQNLFIVTNGKDKIQYWDGVASSIADLPGLTDCVNVDQVAGVVVNSARCFAYFNNFLILGGTTEDGTSYPQRIRWCQQGNVQKWKLETDGSGEAGWGDLTDGVDWIVRLIPFKNYLVAYKERSIQVLTYIGGVSIFDKWPAIAGTGLLAPRAVVDLGDEHIFLGPDNFYSFNFQEVLVAGDDIGKEFFRMLDPNKADLTTAFVVEELDEVWFPFVSTNSPDGLHDMAAVYNYNTKAWSFREMPMTAFGYYRAKENTTIDSFDVPIDSMNMAFDDSTNLANAPINLCGDAQGFIYVLNGHSKDGTDLACYVQTKLFDFKRPDVLKRAKRIQFMISREGDYNLEVRIGTAANVDESISWSEKKYMSLDRTTPPWIDFDVTDRYMMFEFGTPSANQPFRITGYIVYYDERGTV